MASFIRDPVIIRNKIHDAIHRCVNDVDHWPCYITRQEWEAWFKRTGYNDFTLNEVKKGSTKTLSISRNGQKKIIVVHV